MKSAPTRPGRNARPAGRQPQPARGKLTIGLVQMRCVAQPDRNLQHGLELVERAARQGAQVVCLPELFRSLYFCQTEDHAQFALAEPIPGPTSRALAAAARRSRSLMQCRT